METPRKFVIGNTFNAMIPDEYIVDETTTMKGSIAILKAAQSKQGPVVLKIPLPLTPTRSIQAIRHEARILAAVQHPNIVSVVDFIEEEHILVTERLGDNLASFLAKNEQPSLVRAFEMMRDILEGLTALHNAEIVHCDLNPRNVVFKGEKLVLIDFDVASMVGDPCPVTTDSENRLPEYVDGMPVNPAMDIFNLGIVMCNVFWNELPPSPYKELIDKCLHKDPKERPSAASALKEVKLALDRLYRKRGADQVEDLHDQDNPVAAGENEKGSLAQPKMKSRRRT